MKIFLKIFSLVAACLILLTVTAAVFIGWLFDPNEYKDYLADWVESRVGRDFSIEDDLTLTFFPSLGIEASGLRLGNTDGLRNDPFATAERAILRVKILPLLLARVELGNLEIDGLLLNLSRDAAGRGNWEDLLASSNQAATTNTPSTTTDSSSLKNINVEGIEVRDSLIFWRENDTQVRYIVSELSIETGTILIGQPIRTDLSFRLVSVEPQFTATITTTGTALINPANSLYHLDDLQLGYRVEDGLHEERLVGSLRTALSISTNEQIIAFSESQLETELRNSPLGPAEIHLGVTASNGLLNLTTETVQITGLTTNSNGVLANWEISGSSMMEAPELTGSLRIEDESLAAAFDLLDFPLTDVDMTVLGDFDMSATFVVRPVSREVLLSDVTASALNGQISGALSAYANGNTAGYIVIPAFDPRAALNLLPATMLTDIDYSDVDNLAFAAKFNTVSERRQTSIQEIHAEIPEATVNGTFDHYHVERRSEGSLSTSNIAPEIIAKIFPELLDLGMTPNQLGELRISTDFAYDTVTDELQLKVFDTQALGLNGTGNLTASQFLTGSPQITGSIQIQNFNPKELLRRFDKSAPVTADSTVFNSVAIDTRLDVTNNRGIFEDMRLELDGSVVTGDLTIQEFSNPEYDFSLAIDTINVDRYLPLPMNIDGGTPALNNRPIELPTEAMHNFKMNGEITAGNLRLAGIQLSDVSTFLAIDEGVGAIELAKAMLAGGNLDGTIELDARAGVPRLSLEGSAEELQLDPLLVALYGESALNGIGNFDLSLSGIGIEINDVFKTTTGRVNFSIRSGTLLNINLGYSMCDYFNTASRLPRPVETEVDFTAFQLLRGSAIVTDGIARTGDLHATAKFIEFTGRGQTDLTTRDINYDLSAILTESSGIPGCETMDRLIGNPIPLALTGNVNEPLPSFFFNEVIQREALRIELQEKPQAYESELISD